MAEQNGIITIDAWVDDGPDVRLTADDKGIQLDLQDGEATDLALPAFEPWSRVGISPPAFVGARVLHTDRWTETVLLLRLGPILVKSACRTDDALAREQLMRFHALARRSGARPSAAELA